MGLLYTTYVYAVLSWYAFSYRDHIILFVPVVGADFLAALVASCFLGALPPVDLRAVCLVLAMIKR